MLYNYPSVYLYQGSIFLSTGSIYWLLSSHLNLKDSFRTSYMTGLAIINSLLIYLSGNVLFSPSFLKSVLLNRGFLVEFFPFFRYCEYINPQTSGLQDSVEKLDNLIEDLLRRFCSLLLILRFSVCLCLSTVWYNVSQDLWVFLLWVY